MQVKAESFTEPLSFHHQQDRPLMRGDYPTNAGLFFWFSQKRTVFIRV